MKVKVNREICIGCEACAAIAPKTFEMDSEIKAVIKKKDGSKNSGPVDISKIDDTKENILNAASSCPSGAILTEE